MRVLLDTNVLIWALTYDSRMYSIESVLESPRNQVFFSAASIWEIGIKNSKGKLEMHPHQAYDTAIKQRFTELPITSEHTLAIESLSKPDDLDHRDPFDRLMLAQAKVEGLTFYTSDKKISRYDETFIKTL